MADSRAGSRFWPCYKEFLGFRRPDGVHFALIAVAIVAVAATNTALIWLIGTPFDFLSRHQYNELFRALWMFGGLIAVNQIMQFATRLSANALGLRFVGRVRGAALHRLLQISFPAASRFAKGDLLARLSADVDNVQNLMVEMPLFLVSHIATLVFYCAMLVWIDWRLALVALALTPLFVLQQRFFGGRKRRVSQGFFERNGTLLAFEDDALSNLRGISSYNAENLVAARHREIFGEARTWAVKDRLLDASFSAGFSFLVYFCGLVILFFGLHKVTAGAMSVGSLVSFLLYLGYLSVPVRGIAHIPFQSQGDMVAAARVREVLAAGESVVEQETAFPLEVKQGEICLSGVTFAYPDARPVYANVDLTIAGGETVALVGPSGAGKTTLGMLLMRFYDPDRGHIRIDGVDLRDVTLASLRESIAVVWQGPVLINDTLRANLLMARPDADEVALVAACKNSAAWEFISRLPEGLDTRLGAGGMALSAGQGQRLAIAQAFLRDAPILLLDEATSALDSDSERALVAAVERLRHGRTTLIIAHRYSSIRGADRVIYFNGDGTITAGSHTDLLERHPGYRSAVQWQVGA